MRPLLPLIAVILLTSFAEAKPTIYMKNGNDKLEPVLLPVSSTVIPIPVYQVSAQLGVHNHGKSKKLRLTKPEGPIKLITGLKKMASHEVIKPH